jgi:rhamnose transport system ATP-binding protein
MDQSGALVRILGVAKSYGGVQALRTLDLEFHAGEIHALCGENGAGKSTLNKILAGSVKPDSGSIEIEGKALSLGSVAASEQAGIAMVHQESAAFLDLTATENHEIMHEPGSWWIDRTAMRKATVSSLLAVGEEFDPDVALELRSTAQRQMVAIARAVSRNCRLLILDEPTSSLSAKETESLFQVVRELRKKGVAIVYVSHRLEEIFELADRVSVLRDGVLISTQPVADTNAKELIRLMVGREIEFAPRTPSPVGDLLLKVDHLSNGFLQDISLEVRSGEIVGVAGLVGAGRSELARAIFGVDRADGAILVSGGKELLALVPEDRQFEGLHLDLSIRDNLSMAAGANPAAVIDRRAEAISSQALIQELGIKCKSDRDPVADLSGGNQQKVLLGKWLANSPRVLILDEPTRGVDVGAKDQIHRLIGTLADEGAAILLISSELTEVLALSDRIVVMRQGRTAGELSRADATQEKILSLALPTEAKSEFEAKPRVGIRREAAVGLLLVATILIAGAVNPAFLTAENMRDVLVKVAPALIVGSFMTLVILAREIDISVGSLMGLCAAALGTASSTDRLGLPTGVSILICLGMGLLGGLFNGALVAYARIPSIVVTLGTLTLFRAGTEFTMGGRWIENMPDGLRTLGTGNIGGIPYSVTAAAAIAAIGVWLTRRTRLGLRTFALGSNPEAASIHGVDERKTKLALFALLGLAAGVATVFSAPQLQVIESGFGSGFELVVIASVIVGGTSIRGGRGSVVGTLAGTLLLGIVSTVLIFLRLGESATYWERAIQGGMILLAVLFDHLGRRKL